MQVGSAASSLYQLTSGIAATRPDAAARQGAAAPAPQPAPRTPDDTSQVAAGSGPAQTRHPMPRGSLINIVT